ncbi:MAG TPA: radical SAM protein [Gemmatimonadales bacterium]|nr:radical SAM protein [Gemmatimonadales bacterium]
MAVRTLEAEPGIKRQLDLLPSSPPVEPGGLVPLERRARGTEFLSAPVRSVLNTPAATHMPFWSLNPYVGCEFGCTYCYARDTHRYLVERMGGNVEELPAWQAFEQRIIVKPDAAVVLTRTLDPAKLGGTPLVIGTATDPYQPAERQFRLTRQVLEALVPYRGLRIGLITKSPLVTRDLDVLRRLSERHEVTVNISLATLDRRLARRLELRSPVPGARLRALARLTRAGIRAGLLIAPIVPCVTDGRAALDSLFRAAKEAGAHFVVGAALRLGPAAQHRFLPHLAREFPNLVERYEQHYAGRTSVTRTYQEALTRRLRALRRKYGLADDRFRPLAEPDQSPDGQGQLFNG